jgi:hypothetical protein
MINLNGEAATAIAFVLTIVSYVGDVVPEDYKLETLVFGLI